MSPVPVARTENSSDCGFGVPGMSQVGSNEMRPLGAVDEKSGPQVVLTLESS